MADLDKFIKLLSQTDGRDKIYKTLANVNKLLAFQYAADKATSKKFATVAKSIGEGRSLLRMAKWTGNINKLQGYAAKASTLGPKQFVEILRVLGDFGFVLGDNLAYLAKYSVVPLNAKNVGKNSKIFQFWGYVCAVLLDMWSLINLGKKDEAAQAKERKPLILSLIKNTCDLLATLAAVGYAKAYYKPNSMFTGTCGLTSGAIATYTNWNKLK